MQNIITIACALLLFAACVKDKPSPPVNTTSTATTDVVYVACEGSYGNGDATLYQYDVTSGVMSGDVYKAVNNAALGDVFQSIARIDDKLFLCVNNSDKVIVLNRSDKKQIGVISIPKPRYILPIGSNKAYVSTLYSNKVYVINTQTLQVIGTINMPHQNPEGMVLYNSKVYICEWDTACREIFVVDTAINQIVKSIPISGKAPQHALVDKNNLLWIFSGNATKGVKSNITVINSQGAIIKSFQFQHNEDVIKPVIDKNKEILYYIEVNYSGGTDNNGIFKMNISDSDLPTAAFISTQQYQYFWGLGIHPVTSKIYVGDPKGFTQKGSVFIYNSDGTIDKQFAVGIGPGHFYFDNQ